MKKACILKASPRKKGNTYSLLEPVVKKLEEGGFRCREFDLYEMEVLPCLACRGCQQDWSAANCVRRDDMGPVFEAVMESDLIIFASPIYAWYCTAPLKAAMDRMVYAFNKYYGPEKGPAIWAGKSVAIVTTCGYKPEKGTDLFEEGVRRYCKHSGLEYIGKLAERHLGYDVEFMDEEKQRHAEEFADALLKRSV
ncbi:MAG: flavodoxin family protein [Firmicutes bacterium]|nr:flavodoxin family protein [Bacillota bacterium]